MKPCICCRTHETTLSLEGYPFCARCRWAWMRAGGTTADLAAQLRRMATSPTGRTVRGPNEQNIPVRTELGREIRSALASHLGLDARG